MLHIRLKGITNAATWSQIFYPLALGWGPKVFFFFSQSSHVHIKLMGMKHRTPCKQILCPFTHPRSLDVVKTLFSGHGQFAYQIKGNHECNRMVANILPEVPPSDPGVRVKNNFFQSMVMLHIKGVRALRGYFALSPYEVKK